MFSDFRYLDIELIPDSKTLEISFTHPNNHPFISIEMIHELERIFTWLTHHIEVAHIIVTSKGPIFSKGLDYAELENLSLEQTETILQQFRKIVHSLFYLPQILIVDLRKYSTGIASELAIAADIRIAHQEAHISFNHLDYAMVPSCGACGVLDLIVGHSLAKNWIYSSAPISHESLLHSGFIYNFYLQSQEIHEKILTNLSQKAPVAKIQAKRAFLETIRAQIDHTLLHIPKFSMAGMSTMDWKQAIHFKGQKSSQTPQYTSPKDLAKVLSLKS